MADGKTEVRDYAITVLFVLSLNLRIICVVYQLLFTSSAVL